MPPVKRATRAKSSSPRAKADQSAPGDESAPKTNQEDPPMEKEKKEGADAAIDAPPATKAAESAPVAPAKTTERIQEKLPAELAKAVTAAGFKIEDALAVKSYDAQKLWRVVFTQGSKHEFGFDGQWLTKPKPAPDKAKTPAA